MEQLLFAKLSSHAQIPKRADDQAAGYDLYSAQEFNIPPKSRALIKTDIAWSVPNGYFGQICDRSGLAYKSGITCFAGIIDSNYSGNIGVILYNSGDVSFPVEIGDRIAQIIIQKYFSFHPIEVSEINTNTQRGDKGFGSSGK